jgi:uncharacterized protein
MQTLSEPLPFAFRTRDDVTLRADVWGISGARSAAGAPSPGTDPKPALLIRTPYDKDRSRSDSLVSDAVRRGYAVVVQDVRGRYASGGEFDPYRQEGRDGYDSIEAIAAQPWCNGRVAMAGLSYPGAVQWLAAIQAPPHLACIFPAMSFSSGRQFFYFAGAFDLSWIPWTANNIAPDERRRRNLPGPRTGSEARAVWRAGGRAAMRHVPLATLPLLQDATPFFFEWLDHPDDGSYWEFADIESRHDRVAVPAFNFSGWHDEGYGPIGAIRNFVGVRARGATKEARGSRLLIGPWTHGEPTLGSTRVGDLDFGRAAGLDYETLVLDWCDFHARRVQRGPVDPAVRVFVMGANRWRTADTWPLPGTTTKTLHLRAGGRLTAESPTEDVSADRYVYDPANPVDDPHYEKGLGPHDQRSLERRPDVLVYATPPLDEEVEVVGHIEIRLWVASSAPDTDFVARLLDVDEDGAAWNLMSPTLEIQRARYRLSERDPDFLTPGDPVEMTFRLAVTANLFKRGHRIALHVTSSFFPHLERNPNTGRNPAHESRLVAAHQVVFHDAGRPSRILLPVLQT